MIDLSISFLVSLILLFTAKFVQSKFHLTPRKCLVFSVFQMFMMILCLSRCFEFDFLFISLAEHSNEMNSKNSSLF